MALRSRDAITVFGLLLHSQERDIALSIESCVDLGMYVATGHRRTGQHPFGGSTRVLPEWRTQFVCSRTDSVGWGGGVVAEIVRDFQGVVAGIFPVNCNNRPLLIRVNQTCIVFCPNSLDSLPELMSTNCPNWGGGNLT